jgi:hypothetical protein
MKSATNRSDTEAETEKSDAHKTETAHGSI